ncbi:MAG: glycoside hydrolase, partial [Chitinophagaceae bacterium]|nr:glycoside hydrolase [Chitinophagaceae bacterium]
MKKFLLVALSAFLSVVVIAQENQLSLWYKQPADNWNEALPVGNGRLGAMVFGDVEKEHIQLNEESLWAGKQIDDNNPGSAPHLKEIQQLILNDKQRQAYEISDKYMLATPSRFRSYQTLGDLYLDFGQQGDIKNYSRSLDLHTGIAATVYEIDGIQFKREIFSSAPDNIIVVHLTASKPGAINCKVTLSREKDAAITTLAENILQMSGQLVDVSDKFNGAGGLDMKFHALLKTMQDGGTIAAANNSLLVQNATNVTIILTAATDYNFSKLNFDRNIDSRAICESI